MGRIGAAYAVGGDAVGHATAALKLVHEVQHEIGDVATLVQCGMRYTTIKQKKLNAVQFRVHSILNTLKETDGSGAQSLPKPVNFVRFLFAPRVIFSRR